MIRPHATWHDWDWTSEALNLHGIDPAELGRAGTPVQTVFAELRQAIDGRRVIADSSLDSYWWETLAHAAGCPSPSPIAHVGTILDELGATSEMVFRAQAHADAASPARHRAADDARWLWTVLEKLEALVRDRLDGKFDWQSSAAAQRLDQVVAQHLAA